jgi:hypothetical protein
MQCYETFRSKYPQETEVTKITEQDYQTILDDFPNIKSILKSKENSLSFRNPSSSENNKDLIELPPIKISSSGNITEYYKGQANKDGERSGEGELLTSDGNYYKGGFSHNAFNGKGIFINDKGNVFEGNWENGQSKGEGEYSLSSGHRYKGNFENNMKNGKGEETYPDGTKYIGEFVNNEKHGKGELYFPGGEKYTGNFENGVINGEGEFIAKDGTVSIGTFCDGKLNGNAVTTFPDQSKYEGKYVNDLKNGLGTLSWNNGNKLNVNWVKNNPEGKGTVSVGDKEMDVIYRFGKMISCKESN